MRGSLRLSSQTRSVVRPLIVAAIALVVQAQASAQGQGSQQLAPSTAALAVPAKTPDRSEDEIGRLKAVVADQQKRIEQLELSLEVQRKLIEQVLHVSTTSAASDSQKSAPPVSVSNNAPPPDPSPPIQKTSADEPSPLSLHIGNV